MSREQESQEEVYSKRLLSFFATTLKSLDNPSYVSQSARDVLENAVRIASQDLGVWSGVYLRSDLKWGGRAAAHFHPDLEPILLSFQGVDFPDPDSFFSPMNVIRSGVPVFKADVSEELQKLSTEAPQIYDMLYRLGVRSYISVPLKRGEDTIGSFTVARSAEARPFDSVDFMMVEEFAAKVGLNIEMSLLYESLADLKNAAESANRAKTNFLANVSHEIRTPLGAILGFSELLLETNANQQDRQNWSQKIRSNGNHLLRIIDDILDLSKVEVGTLDLEIKKIDLRMILNEIFIFAQNCAIGKNISVEFVMEGSLPRYIFSDETRLAQILSNVIGNAIKFTSEGFVRLKVGRSKDQLQNIYFEVSDSGIGVEREQAALLFQPFTQGTPAHARQFGGTGLGLALSRNLAQRLGGNLVLKESEVGRGSTFLIQIHVGATEEFETFSRLEDDPSVVLEIHPDEDFVHALMGKDILVVEDSLDIQVLLKRVLEGAGAKVSLAENGEEGVRAASIFNYDVVLMDVQMPIKDGCQAARELRALGYDGLIIALTANAMKEEQDRCLAAGFDAHLSKPMRRYELIRNIIKIAEAHKRKSLEVPTVS